MGKIKTFLKLLKNDRAALRQGIAVEIGKSNLSHILSDKAYLRLQYRLFMGKKLDLKNPRTFNEKLQWLKLNDRDPQYITMVDKYAAKKYVGDIIGEEYIIPTLGVWERVDDIDFDSLPDQFVLKCTHDSKSVIICRDKASFDIEAAKKTLAAGLKTNLFYWGREWPYKDVPPKIIAEKYMTDEHGELLDYKIHCFNGEPQFILICQNRFSELTEDFYSIEWKHLNVRRPNHPNSKKEIHRPNELEKMLELSRILSKSISFLRVDFYIVDCKIYFGELTFYPASGFEKYVPDEWDNEIGMLLKLPIK